MCCEDKLLRHLHECGFRLTPQREMVLKVLHDVKENATIDEIYARVSALCTAVDLSTVYRTLDLLEGFALVSSFKLGDGQRHYELLSLHRAHFHLLCRNCGNLVAIDVRELQPLRGQLVQDGQVLDAAQHALHRLHDRLQRFKLRGKRSLVFGFYAFL